MSRGGRNQAHGTRSGFTLAELAMAIAVLAIAGVFLVQVFLSADRLAKKASDLDRSVSLCTASVEAWKAGEDAHSLSVIPVLSGAEVTAPFSARVFLDDRMEPTAQGSATFTLTASLGFKQDEDLVHLTVTVAYAGQSKPLYSLEAARWAGPAEENR